MMDLEEAYYNSRINFYKLLKEPNRIVAKIEKKKCSRKEISHLLGQNRFSKQHLMKLLNMKKYNSLFEFFKFFK